jgi:hypothetical protein
MWDVDRYARKEREVEYTEFGESSALTLIRPSRPCIGLLDGSGVKAKAGRDKVGFVNLSASIPAVPSLLFSVFNHLDA